MDAKPNPNVEAANAAELNGHQNTAMDTEQMMQVLLQTVVDGVVTIDDQGIMLAVNPAVERIFGYSKQELVGQNVSLLMVPDQASKHNGYLSNYLRTGEKKIIGKGREVIGRRRDGSEVPLELSVNEMRGADRPVFVGVVRDISERRAANEQMKIQSSALAAAANAILICTREGVIEWANPAFTQLTGYSLEEVLSKSTRLLKSGQQSADFYRDMWQTVIQGKVWQGELVNRRKDGSLYTEEQTITPIMESDGRISHFIVIKLDVTDRKEAEQALERKNHELEAATEFERSQSQILALFNSRFELADVCRLMLGQLAEVHGFLVSAVYLTDFENEQLTCIANHGMPGDFSPIFKMGEGLVGQVAVSAEQLVVNHDIPIKIETGLAPIYPSCLVVSPLNFAGKVMGVLVLASASELDNQALGYVDRLTDQVGIALNNLHQYHSLRTLSEQLQARGEEISKKNAELEQANRLKSEFLANMSHELRTPLNAIIGFSEVLKDELLGNLTEEQQDYTKEIFESANHLLSLINDILDLSKIEAGKMELLIDSLNVKETLRNALSVVRERALNSKISLELDVDESVSFVEADGRKFKQILFNLLSNAVKFTPEEGRVHLSAQVVGDYLSIKVTDTGIGIAADKLDMLFKPFEQVDGSLSRRFEGTGLGLAMVKRLVDLHGGNVNVASVEGEGSCFEVVMPVNQATPEERMVIRPPSTLPTLEKEVKEVTSEVVEPVVLKPSFEHTQATADEAFDHKDGRPKLLIVEDDSSSVEIIRKQLEDIYQIASATTGMEALRKATALEPDLIVLDIMLPGMDGWEILQRLQDTPELVRIPVIVLSIVADVHKGMELGAIGVLEKPVRKHALINSINLALPDLKDHQGRILVVDDDENITNFMQAHLVSEGFQPLIAFNGIDALEMCMTHKPDLVILDLMMPDLDGFGVIAELRENESTRDLPILVVTQKDLDLEETKVLREHMVKVVNKSGLDMYHFIADVERHIAARKIVSHRTSKPKNSNAPLILVIEDDKNQREILSLYLEDVGYRVQQAENGKQALDKMDRELPDLITLDLRMPVMDGFEFLEIKTQDINFAEIPVVLLSSDIGPMDPDFVPPELLVQKPVSGAKLMELVEHFSRHKTGAVKVLIIDDDRTALDVMESELDADTFDVEQTSNGLEGFERACQLKPDIILLDLVLPTSDGIEVLRRVKNHDDTKNIPVVVLTGKTLDKWEKIQFMQQVALVQEKSKSGPEFLTSAIQQVLREYQ